MSSKVSSLARGRDEVLIAEYGKIPDQSSEAIIRDPDLSAALLKSVNRQLSKADRFDQVGLNKRLESLRKQSKLPRKFRDFNGRDAKRKAK